MSVSDSYFNSYSLWGLVLGLGLYISRWPCVDDDEDGECSAGHVQVAVYRSPWSGAVMSLFVFEPHQLILHEGSP